MQDKYLTVSAINRYLKHKLDTDGNLFNVFLKGEISNLKMHSTGHIYFSIKDDNSKINAIMFSSNAKKLTFLPQDGDKVLLSGRISVYEASGSYQIYVNEMEKDGVGNLYLAYEKLKKDLAKEGLFDKCYKKSIPKYPSKIGVITAKEGAAVRDIISTIKRRYPICDVILFPSLVQGDNAYKSIISSIDKAEMFDLDVLIIGRGGGSIEDLWPFNEEELARRIFKCKIPTISAVGHEIDYTIADFVADLRAPTPTGAAEMAVPNLPDLVNYIKNLNVRLNEAINAKINYQKLYLDSIKNSFVIKNPMIMFESKSQKLDLLFEKINKVMINNLNVAKHRFELIKNNHVLNNPNILYRDKQTYLENIINKLELLNPLNSLKRGFSITYKDNKLVKDIDSVDIKDNIDIKVANGIISATIIEKRKVNE